MIYWAQLFHFYQPPTQLPVVLEKICNESYKPLLDTLLDNPHAHATLNVNGVLLEMLQDYGHKDVLMRLGVLGEKGGVEFTGTAKYHAILPLIPCEERRRQIELNAVAAGRLIGKAFAPRGFFPPEMCYSQDILPEIISSGCQWIIVGGIACPSSWPINKIYEVESEGKKLAVFFRDDILSNKISFKQIGPADFFEHLKQLPSNGGDIYLITAMDAETYGHHIRHWETLFLASVYERLQPGAETFAGIKQASELSTQNSILLQDVEFARQVKMVTISELLDKFPRAETIAPKASSWSTTAEDLAAGKPYPLWLDKDNEIHRLQWEHLGICFEVVNKAQEYGEVEECRFFAQIARGLLDLALHSDQFWWASRRPMWDMNLIHLGLVEQWRAIVNGFHAINKSKLNDEVKRDYYHKVVAAGDLRNKIIDRLFII